MTGMRLFFRWINRHYTEGEGEVADGLGAVSLAVGPIILAKN